MNTPPVTLKVTRPSTGQEYKAVLNGDRLVALLVELLSFTDTLPHLPGMIYELHAGNTDFSAELIEYVSLVAAIPDFNSEGAALSVICKDEVSFSSPQIIQEVLASQPSPLWDLPTALGDFDECDIWNVQPAPSIENQPVLSEIPTLILAGDMDPVTPPVWGELAGEKLKNSYYEEFVGVSHGVYGAGQLPLCSKVIVRSFLENPQIAPDAACLSTLNISFSTK